MIGNEIPCPDPHQAMHYLLVGRRAEILMASPKVIAHLFNDPLTALGARQISEVVVSNTALRSRVPRPYRHAMMSVPPGENLANNWKACALALLRIHGVDPTKHDFVVVLHTDRDHQHIHLVWSRIGPDASLIRDRMGDGALTQKVCREMEIRFGLRKLVSSLHEVPGVNPSSGERKRKRPKRSEFEMEKRGVLSEKERLRQRLRAAWPAPSEVISYEALTARWREQGIEIEVCKKKTTAGVVYHIDGQRRKASELGKEFQWKALEQHIDRTITPEDIGAIKSVRPGTKPRKLAPVIEEHLQPIAVSAKPIFSRMKPPTPKITVNLLAVMEDAYVRFSAAKNEAERLRRTSRIVPERSKGYPPSPSFRLPGPRPGRH